MLITKRGMNTLKPQAALSPIPRQTLRIFSISFPLSSTMPYQLHCIRHITTSQTKKFESGEAGKLASAEESEPEGSALESALSQG
jgi:hypothetical protein